MSINTATMQDYVKYIFILSIISALAMSVSVDYVLIELWLYGIANLTILIITPVFMFMLSVLVISLITMIKQFRGGFGNAALKAKALMITYTVFFILAMIYFTYISVIHYTMLGLVVTDYQLVGDHYLGFGLALYNAGLFMMSWQLTEDLISDKLSSLYRFFIMQFRYHGDDEDDAIIVR
ncbi:MAG: hypothetical protein RXP99_04775 [Vulcanisaeta sp.]|nr:hypothetical protein [Vulcanisaeta sp.]